MYENQMEMFQEGGVTLNDEGGEVEATSGNDVPLGGTKEGVADDQPANLSAGEMVLSEDVVRYHGVEKLMALRDEAKIGFHKMEAMGQLGNADEATIPSEAVFNPGGMPFSIVDLEYIDMDDDVDEAEAAGGMYIQNKNNMQTGGIVRKLNRTDERITKFLKHQQNVKPINAQQGTLVPLQQPPPLITSIDEETGLPVTTAADPAILPQVLQPAPSAPITTSVPTTLSPISQPTAPPPIQQPTTPLPTIDQFMGGVQGVNHFQNEDGQVIQIPVVNGTQIYPTPEGFQPFNPEDPQPFTPAVPEEEAPEEPVETVEQRRPGGIQPGGAGPGSFAAGVDVNVTNAAIALQRASSTAEAQAIADAYNTGPFAIENSSFYSNLAAEAQNNSDNSGGWLGEIVSLFDGGRYQAQTDAAADLAHNLSGRDSGDGAPDGYPGGITVGIGDIHGGGDRGGDSSISGVNGMGSAGVAVNPDAANPNPSLTGSGFWSGMGRSLPGTPQAKGGLVSKPKKKSNKSKRNRMGLAVPK